MSTSKAVFFGTAIPALILVPLLVGLGYYWLANKMRPGRGVSPIYYLLLSRDVAIATFVVLLAILLFVASHLA